MTQISEAEGERISGELDHELRAWAVQLRWMPCEYALATGIDERMLGQALAIGRMIFAAEGFVRLSFLIFRISPDTGQVEMCVDVLPSRYSTSVGNQAVAEMVEIMAGYVRPIAVAMLVESLILTGDAADEYGDSEEPIDDHPSRIEGVFASVEMFGFAIGGYHSIDRSGPVATLGEDVERADVPWGLYEESLVDVRMHLIDSGTDELVEE